MITVSKAAAKQIRLSMEETGTEGMSLRVAARRLDDGSLDYAMGFDETDHNDSHNRTNGIDVVVAPTSTELLSNAVLDYVEMENGDFQFIFVNPNDPGQVAPEQEYLDQVMASTKSRSASAGPGDQGVVPDQGDLLSQKSSFKKPPSKKLPGFKPA